MAAASFVVWRFHPPDADAVPGEHDVAMVGIVEVCRQSESRLPLLRHGQDSVLRIRVPDNPEVDLDNTLGHPHRLPDPARLRRAPIGMYEGEGPCQGCVRARAWKVMSGSVVGVPWWCSHQGSR